MSKIHFCPNCGHDLNKYDEVLVTDSQDDVLKEAVKVAIEAGSVSPSLLQRQLRIGYARAARLIDTMEQLGYIGPAIENGQRKVLISSIDEA